MTEFLVLNISIAVWNFFAVFATLLLSWILAKFCFKVIAPYSILVIIFSFILMYAGIIPT